MMTSEILRLEINQKQKINQLEKRTYFSSSNKQSLTFLKQVLILVLGEFKQYKTLSFSGSGYLVREILQKKRDQKSEAATIGVL